MKLKDSYSNCIDNKNSVFSILTNREKELLRRSMTFLKYNKCEMVFREGENPKGLICLIQGVVKIFKEGVGGREQILRMARPGHFIGYRALFNNEPYLASAYAIDNTSVCMFEKDILFKLIRGNSELSFRFIKLFANELGIANLRTISLTQKHIRGRLAESLIVLRDTYGYESNDRTLRVYLSREDLANLSNMTTSNAIRTLSAFAREGIIEINARKISILDIEKLYKISELG